MTHPPSPERLFSLCIDLASIPSVTGLPGRENEAAYSIYRWLGDLPYFHERPENIFLIPVQNDGLKRHCIAALVEADPPCKETIIITGHFDVVDAKGYGSLESLAFQPQNYTERLKKEALPKDARADLESGQYLFGRGMADMKYGLALEMACMEKFSESPEKCRRTCFFWLFAMKRGCLPECEAQYPGSGGFKRKTWNILSASIRNPQWGVSGEGLPLFRNHRKNNAPFLLCWKRSPCGGIF